MIAAVLAAASAVPAMGDFMPAQSSVEPGFVVPSRGKIGDTDADIRAPRVSLDLGAKWMLSPRWLFGLGAGIEHSHYRFSDFGTLLPGASEPLRDAFQVKLSPTFTYLHDDRWAFVAGVNFGAAGDPDASVPESMTVGGLLGARRQFSRNFALTLGVAGSTRLEDVVRVLPVIGVEWQIAHRWRLDTQGPSGRLSYQINDPLQVFLRLAYETREFRLADDASIPGGVLRDQSIPVSLGIGWQASPSAKVTFQIGTLFSGSVRLRDDHRRTLVDEDVAGAPFVSLGVNVGFGGARSAAGATGEPRDGRAVDLSRDEDTGVLAGHTVQAWEENDSVTGTDHSYTQGLQFAYLAPEHATGSMPGWLAWFGEGLPSIGFETERARATFATGQLIFTPVDIHTSAYQPGDRPYAGWIYGAPALQRRGTTAGGIDVLEELRLGLGWVGPGALAGEAQNFIHRNLSIGQGLGWEHQLRNEPTGDLTYARAWRATLAGDRDGGAVDIVPHVALTGGTPRTQASAGATLRIGVNLPDDFGRPTIQSGLPVSGGTSRPFGVHLFAGIEGRAIAGDTFLDGNLWRSGPSIDKEPFGLESRVGFAVTSGKVDLGFTYARQSPETSVGERKTHDFGSVWLSWRI